MDRNFMQRSTVQPPFAAPYQEGVQGSILASLLAQQLFDPVTGRVRAVQAFEYCPQPWNPLVAATTVPRTVQISNTHDFMVFSVVGSLRNPAAPFAEDPDAAVLIEVISNASDMNLTERQTDWLNVVGTAQNPHYLPVPLFWRGGSSVTVTLQNLMATDVIARLSFVGSRVYDGPIG